MAARRRGFTLIELLVVMSIIAALMGLLLPAVQSAREAARRSQCLSNTNQFALATQQFEGSHGYYPGYFNNVGGKTVPYLVSLMPHLERMDLYRYWSDVSNSTSASLAPATVYMPIAVCPSNPPASQSGTPISYIVNSGIGDASYPVGVTGNLVQTLLAASGVFQDRTAAAASLVKVNADYVSSNDGLGMTLMFSENLLPASSWYTQGQTAAQARVLTSFVWFSKLSVPSTSPASYQINANRINTPATAPSTLEWSRPSSNHPGGVNVAFCGGNTRFLGEDIAYGVYKQLMSPNGLLVDQTLGGTTATPVDSDQRAPLNESQF